MKGGYYLNNKVEARYLRKIKEKLEGKKVCIFPMGVGGRDMRDKLSVRSIEVDFFCDNNKAVWGTSYNGTKCISYPELVSMNSDDVVVIVESSFYYDAIKEQLASDGIKNCVRIFFEKIFAEEYVNENRENLEQRIEKVLEILADERSKEVYQHLVASWDMEDIPDNYFKKICSENQYFEKGLIELGEQEVFVDCGAYTGDSARDFLKASHGKYKKMHLFELSPTIYRELERNVAEVPNVQCYPYGVSDKNQEVEFVLGERNSSIQSAIAAANGKEEKLIGQVKTLDEVLAGEEVTFIKMDIEGAEQSALEGARELIKSQKPVLAICIYHSPQDMLELPVLIKQLNPEYKIYIRHYTEVMFETVCYAVL